MWGRAEEALMVYDASIRPPRRTLTDTQERRLTALVGMGRPLQPVERGELTALARHASVAQQDQALAKLRDSGSHAELAAAAAESLARYLDNDGA
jgi:hypothetical protein